MTVAVIVVFVAALALLAWRIRQRRRTRARHAGVLDGVELELAVTRRLYGTPSSTVARVRRSEPADDHRIAA